MSMSVENAQMQNSQNKIPGETHITMEERVQRLRAKVTPDAMQPIKPDAIYDVQKQETIKKVESLPFNQFQKAQLILLLLGEQQAIEIDFMNEEEGALEKVQAVVEKAGLSVQHITDRVIRNKPTNMLFIGKNPQKLQELKDAVPQVGAIQDHEKYAHLMGFPQTAIDAFTGKIPRSEKTVNDLPPHLAMLIITSKDHYDDEIAFLERRTELLKKHAPKLYEEMMAYRNS